MKSYTQGRNLAGVWTKNSATDNLAYLDQTANDDYRHICALKDWPFLERNRTLTAVAAQQGYTLPYDCDQVRAVSFQPVGSNMIYTLGQVPDQDAWTMLNINQYTSDIPEAFYVFNGQVNIWPTPNTSGSSIFITQKSRVIDLSQADVTAGTITSITNGTTAVVGSGTAWTSMMVGRYIRITYGDAAGSGDGLWYEIAGVADATHLTLVRAYGGTTIAAGTAAYTIGQMPLLPEAFHDLPWQWAAGVYWQKEADKRADAFLSAHGQPGNMASAATGRIKELIAAWSSPTTNLVIDTGDSGDELINPNLTVRL